MTPVYEYQSDTVLRAHRSPSKQQQQPSRIEDYEPGRCSLGVSNGVEVTYQLLFFCTVMLFVGVEGKGFVSASD